ncbi:aminotransferase class V-fold PLP-dependent enzyme [Rhodovulum visakhapatnamense]|uniref:Alanine--glyoxylate aminotransferase family protein n=1 Tax=Rhodovulum visakhapatnamense TaxID=364297 RepID=A0ABS1RAM9_9RHOB|nr:aminotransferase class V-fold PLP-dependent enzyme [Rhodovulum visakhapatnamense]MBL3569343.1 alanine--glyoxylate aminotransferase family protein [Rhodovulum visakhapatnamense]MBL3576699.1 alanine--glyoxylate aminotransferase family protein [Rhodovulum visakhapatnamense]
MSSRPPAPLPPSWLPLPDAPAFPADGYAPLADAIGRLIGTANDVLLVQGEAMVALEAAASSLGRPGVRALNVVTSLYGRWFGGWLRRAGAEVTDLAGAAPGHPITTDAVARALEAGRYDLVALVHAESATGILNPLPGIVALARAHGALVVVDAVASLGGHPVEVDALGIDVAVMGPQKALGGQAGTSAIAVSPAAWDRIAPPGEAPSILSLADLRTLWLETGRGALPGTPSALEFHSLAQTLARVEAEGMAAIRARHGRAAAAARAGARALTGAEWVAPGQASNLVTAAALPEGLSATELLTHASGDALSAGVGPAGERLVRLNHTGPRARLETVLGDLATLGEALDAAGHPAPTGAALSAAEAAWREAETA